MARKSGKGVTATANRIVSMCIASREPDVVEAVTRIKNMSLASIRWGKEERTCLEGYTGGGGNAVGFARELVSAKARQFWTSSGILGRLRAYNGCLAFSSASIVDAMSLFLANEVCIRPEDFRKVFRYVFGVSDVEFLAALRELVKNGTMVIASVCADDNAGYGPFVLLCAETGGDSVYAWHIDDPNAPQPTIYDVACMNSMMLDALLMRMFIVCDIDDNPEASGQDIEPYAALDRFYVDGTGTLDDCYPYIQELLEIGSREKLSWERTGNAANYQRAISALDKAVWRNRIHFQDDDCTADNEVVYCPPPNEELQEQLADEQDCAHACDILKQNMDLLRKGCKSGKTVHSEIIRFVLDEIPKIFTFKTMYDIFAECDMEPEVIRRNVYALCKDGTIVKVRRGMYCSKSYADAYFLKYVKNNTVDNDTFWNDILKTQFNKLEKQLSILCRELEKFGSNSETVPDSEENDE